MRKQLFLLLLLYCPLVSKAQDCSQLYIIGGATLGGWNLDDASSMMRVENSNDKFSWRGYLVCKDFKFVTGRAFSPAVNASRADELVVVGHSQRLVYNAAGENDYKFVIPENGVYDIVVDTKAMTMMVKRVNRVVENGYDYKWTVSNDHQGEYKVTVDVLNETIDATLVGAVKRIPDFGYASFSAQYSVALPDGVVAYKARLDDDQSAVVLSELSGGVIPSNTGVILYSKEEGRRVLKITDEKSSADFSDNSLVATSAEGNSVVPADGTFYALMASEPKFARLENGIVLSDDKAYLPASVAGDAKTLNFIIEGGTNGVLNINRFQPSDSNVYYNLMGIKVKHPSKGLYIHNGRKVVIQ